MSSSVRRSIRPDCAGPIAKECSRSGCLHGSTRLLELCALEKDLPLVGYGSTTFRKEAAERGAEPDACYRVGTMMKDGEFPDK